jgi:hypothetical protein
VDCSNDMYGRDGHIQEGEKDEAVSWNSAASMGCHSSPLTYSVDTVEGIPTTRTSLHNARLFNTMALHLTTLISRSNREVLALNYNCRLSGIISTNLPTQVGSNRGRALIARPERDLTSI